MRSLDFTLSAWGLQVDRRVGEPGDSFSKMLLAGMGREGQGLGAQPRGVCGGGSNPTFSKCLLHQGSSFQSSLGRWESGKNRDK